MDRPLPFNAEGGSTAGSRGVAVRILKIAKGAIDGTESIGPASDDHAGERRMPLVTGIVRVQSADIDGTRPAARRIVGNAEMHGLEPGTRLRDRFHIRHTQSGLDQYVDPDPVRNSLGFLDLG